MKAKRISVREYSEHLSDNELKSIRGGYGSGGQCSLKCFNDVTTVYVWRCPSSLEEAIRMCVTHSPEGYFRISCAGPSSCYNG